MRGGIPPPHFPVSRTPDRPHLEDSCINLIGQGGRAEKRARKRCTENVERTRPVALVFKSEYSRE